MLNLDPHNPLPEHQGESHMLTMNQKQAIAAYAQSSVGDSEQLAKNDRQMRLSACVAFLEIEERSCLQMQKTMAHSAVKYDEAGNALGYQGSIQAFFDAAKRRCMIRVLIDEIEGLQEGGEK